MSKPTLDGAGSASRQSAMVNRCPCCASPLIGGALHLTSVVPAARAGDRYCLTCEWLVTETLLLEYEQPPVCPHHPRPLATPGVGPGAQSRWEAALIRYGEARRRFSAIRRVNSALRLASRDFRSEMRALRSS